MPLDPRPPSTSKSVYPLALVDQRYFEVSSIMPCRLFHQCVENSADYGVDVLMRNGDEGRSCLVAPQCCLCTQRGSNKSGIKSAKRTALNCSSVCLGIRLGEHGSTCSCFGSPFLRLKNHIQLRLHFPFEVIWKYQRHGLSAMGLETYVQETHSLTKGSPGRDHPLLDCLPF